MEVVYQGPGQPLFNQGGSTEAADILSTIASGDVLSIPILTLKQKSV